MLSTMKITLTNQQKQELKVLHDTTRDGRVRDIADALLIHESTVRQHLNDYIQLNKLKPQNGGSQSHLSTSQTRALVGHLTENTYHHTHQIVAYVWASFGVKYSVPGMNKWLHQHGFSYKQPKGVPHKFDEKKQADFIEFYKRLKASLGKEEAIIFMDAVHPTQATKSLMDGYERDKIKSLKQREAEVA